MMCKKLFCSKASLQETMFGCCSDSSICSKYIGHLLRFSGGKSATISCTQYLCLLRRGLHFLWRKPLQANLLHYELSAVSFCRRHIGCTIAPFPEHLAPDVILHRQYYKMPRLRDWLRT